MLRIFALFITQSLVWSFHVQAEQLPFPSVPINCEAFLQATRNGEVEKYFVGEAKTFEQMTQLLDEYGLVIDRLLNRALILALIDKGFPEERVDTGKSNTMAGAMKIRRDEIYDVLVFFKKTLESPAEEMTVRVGDKVLVEKDSGLAVGVFTHTPATYVPIYIDFTNESI